MRKNANFVISNQKNQINDKRIHSERNTFFK